MNLSVKRFVLISASLVIIFGWLYILNSGLRISDDPSKFCTLNFPIIALKFFSSSCSISKVTELIKTEHKDLAEEFYKSANYLYPFGVLVLMKIDNISQQDAEKKYFFDVDTLTKDYMDFMRVNGVINKSFFKGTFIGDDLNFCNEIRAAIETTISETKKNN